VDAFAVVLSLVSLVAVTVLWLKFREYTRHDVQRRRALDEHEERWRKFKEEYYDKDDYYWNNGERPDLRRSDSSSDEFGSDSMEK
jgi:hypothetical protein